MSEYNISFFIKIMQSTLVDISGQEDTARLLLSSIASRDDVLVDINARMVTNLVKRNNEIHEEIKIASSKHEVIDETINYFETDIIPKLNPHTKEDTFSEILKTLENDNTVSEHKYNELKDFYLNGKTGLFLAHCLLYAINKTNKVLSHIPTADDYPLLKEVNNHCPSYTKSLVKTEKVKSISQYKITRIFPEGLNKSEEQIFKDTIAPPSKLESNDNKIALCHECSHSYTFIPDVDEYKLLMDLKSDAIRSTQTSEYISSMDIEQKITEVVDALGEIDNLNNLQPLSLDAVSINKKILPANVILISTLTNHVLTYYNFIKDSFSRISSFNRIATEIKLMYIKLESIESDQNAIVEQLADWILLHTKKTANHKEACKIIVAFFVQNCEVFNEIT